MSHASCRSRQHLTTAILVATAAALVACSDGDQRDTQSPPPPKLPLASLKKRFDDMPVAEFQDFVHNQVTFTKHHNFPRKCKHAGPNLWCLSSSSTTTVSVRPADGSASAGTANGQSVSLPPNGYIIARFDNIETSPEAWLLIPGHQTAYWLVEPDQNGKARSRFVLESKQDLISPMEFRGCSQPPTPTTVDSARFADCKLMGHGTVSALDATLADVKSTWLSCVAGCCTTESIRQPTPAVQPGAATRTNTDKAASVALR
jgi:hypothetical protein